MNTELITGTVGYVVAMVLMISAIWGLLFLISSRVEDIRVVEVEPGVKCAVTSRMLNTSIDCWREE